MRNREKVKILEVKNNGKKGEQKDFSIKKDFSRVVPI